MAAPTIEAIMQGIEARLATISGLRVNDIKPDQINPPAAVVGVPPVDYLVTMRQGHFSIGPTVTVAVSAAFDRIGQLKLAGYANITGPTSIFAAIMGDTTLGGVAENCVVTDFNPGTVRVSGVEYYGGVFTLKVVAVGA